LRISVLAPGKVNLCLFLGGLRPDGRHELVTVFESVSLADELVLTTLPGGRDEVVAPGVEGPNLVADALAGLRARDWAAPAVRVEIDKRIPVAAGMGGGSADAAAALRLARRVAPVSAEAIAEVAAGLGADVPAQLEPGVALGTGAGERVEPIYDLAAHAFLLVPLPYRLLTRDVYAEADRLGLPRADRLGLPRADRAGLPRADLQACLREVRDALEPGARLPDSLLVNDLQPAATSLCPAISGALDAVLDAGADRALVCGSGPTVAGVFWGDHAGYRAADAAIALRTRFPHATDAIPVDSDFALPVLA
jgi:4-diphosphocytidyl-2-C-methyl-D-erythritol kinase